MATKKKSSAARKSQKRPNVRKSRKTRTAVPPHDDPGRRHESTNADRFVVPGERESTIALRRLKAIEEMKNMNRPKTARPESEEKPDTDKPQSEDADKPGILPTQPVPGTLNWVQMGPQTIVKGQTLSSSRKQVTGRVSAFLVDPGNPNILYLGAAQGGIWKSTDGGAHWTPKSDNEASLAVGAIAMDPANHSVLYVGTGEGNFAQDSYYGAGVLRSADGGDTWTLLGTAAFAGTRFSRLLVSPANSNRLFAATNSGLYRSNDAASTWTKLAGGLPNAACTDVAINPSNADTVYAAFAGQGVYRTTNAGAANPAFTKLTSGLPTSGFFRIALAVSPTSPQTVYALIGNNATFYTLKGFYVSYDGGTTWSSIPLPAAATYTGSTWSNAAYPWMQSFYNLVVSVDPTTPDIVYVSLVSLFKASKSGTTWTITNIGNDLHADHHCLAFHPTDHLTLFDGNDGGIFKSADGGATWSDKLNKWLCITQFEFLDQHPTSDAVVFGGTQDNGTEQYRAGPMFYHADDGDGGFCIVDPSQPLNVLSTYYGPSPKRSTQGGAFGTWFPADSGISGDGLFYPPLVACQTDPNRVAIGTDRINLDTAQGTAGWTTKISLPGLPAGDSVSAICYVDANLIYAGTSEGRVYRCVFSGGAWSANLISAAPLPASYIWDISTLPSDSNTVILVMSGFGIAHVWRAAVPGSGTAAWTDISGTAPNRLPDIPVNALVIDPSNPTHFYIASDIAVFRTLDSGAHWSPFSNGLPNVAVFDLRLHSSLRLLRAGTHGRGMWELRLDQTSTPAADVYVRDHVMDTGRYSPSPGGILSVLDDPGRQVSPGNQLWFWMCADIKVDAVEGSPVPSFQMPVADVDPMAFEGALVHRDPQRGRTNRLYVQIHNRGFQPAANLQVKSLWAVASAGLPSLPADFWTAFPNDPTSTVDWHPVGSFKTIPSLAPGESAILEWDWTTPTSADDHSCMLVVVDSASDPIPAANKTLDPGVLVPAEKHVGLKNLHVVNPPPGNLMTSQLAFYGSLKKQNILLLPGGGLANVGLLFPKKAVPSEAKMENVTVKVLPKTQLRELTKRYGDRWLNTLDLTRLYLLSKPEQRGRILGLRIPARGWKALVVAATPERLKTRLNLTIAQQEGNRIVGGSTFVLLPG